MGSSTEKSYLSILKEALVALGVDIAFKEWMKCWGTYGAMKFRHRVINLEQNRAELLHDIMALDKQDKIKNLMHRHKQAVNNLDENRFVSLLTKIPKQERRQTLAWMDTLSDQEFNQVLDLLDNDVVMEWLTRMRHRIGRISAKDFQALTANLQKAWKKIDATANSAAPAVKNFTTWLDGLGR